MGSVAYWLVLTIAFLLFLCSILFMCGWFEEVKIMVGAPPCDTLVAAYRYYKPHEYQLAGKEILKRSDGSTRNYKSIVIQYGERHKLMDYGQRICYAAGVVLSDDGSPPNADLITSLMSQGYHIMTFPRINHAVFVEYHYRFNIAFQFASYRVYSRLLPFVKHRKLSAYPAVEVYDQENKSILFMFPLARQDDFYVHEVVRRTFSSLIKPNDGARNSTICNRLSSTPNNRSTTSVCSITSRDEE